MVDIEEVEVVVEIEKGEGWGGRSRGRGGRGEGKDPLGTMAQCWNHCAQDAVEQKYGESLHILVRAQRCGLICLW